MLGGMERESAPARADLEQSVAGLQVDQPGQPVELRTRRVGERCLRVVEDRAGVRHRLVEHPAEEFVPDVVVRPRVAPVTARIGAPVPGDGVDDRAEASVHAIATGVHWAQTTEREPQEPGEVVGVPPTVGIRLAQADAAPAQHGFVCTRIVHHEASAQLGRVRDHSFESGSGRSLA